jgi:hypothetical protein
VLRVTGGAQVDIWGYTSKKYQVDIHAADILCDTFFTDLLGPGRGDSFHDKATLYRVRDFEQAI